jgi:hypothetical protein
MKLVKIFNTAKKAKSYYTIEREILNENNFWKIIRLDLWIHKGNQNLYHFLKILRKHIIDQKWNIYPLFCDKHGSPMSYTLSTINEWFACSERHGIYFVTFGRREDWLVSSSHFKTTFLMYN